MNSSDSQWRFVQLLMDLTTINVGQLDETTVGSKSCGSSPLFYSIEI